MKIVTYREGDLYSVATALGIICSNVDRATAVDAILETVDVSRGEAELYLDNPVDAATYRAAYMQAISATLDRLALQVNEVTDQNSIVGPLKRIADIMQRQELKRELKTLERTLLRALDEAKLKTRREGEPDLTDNEILAYWTENNHPLVEQTKQLLGERI